MLAPGRISILDCQFDCATFASAVETCLEWCCGPRSSHTVITANAGILCMMRHHPELRRACLAGDLIIPDGVAVVWASRLAGAALPERIAGVDLMTELLAVASREKRRVYFLGAKIEVIHALISRCGREYPGLIVAGARDGYFKESDHAVIIEEIRDSQAHFLFVAMPTPFKEVWCEKHRERLNVPVIMGVGGSFDVLAGYIERAPVWLQSVGMEWSWRLAMEPRKMWKRYLTTNTEFIWLTAREVLKRRVFDKASSS